MQPVSYDDEKEEEEEEYELPVKPLNSKANAKGAKPQNKNVGK